MKDQTKIKEILNFNSIAVVGFSPKKERPSNYVSMYMQKNGYSITPVNPGHQYICNLKCYPNLESINQPIDSGRSSSSSWIEFINFITFKIKKNFQSLFMFLWNCSRQMY